MNDWKPTLLGDLIEIRHGYAFKGEYFKDTQPGQILLTPGNFAVGGGFQLGKIKYYDGPPVPGYTLSAGELLVTMTDLSKEGDTLGYPALVPADNAVYLHNQRIGKVLLKSAEIEIDFIYWLLRTNDYRTEILASCTGSTVKHTSPGRIAAFRFLLPPREMRLQICKILNALDDKIELNRRMNETLEAMAQVIFRDWFVVFGPTRRKLDGATDPLTIMGGLVQDAERAQALADLFPATLGDDGLPEGWKKKALLEEAKLISGGTPKTDRQDYWDGGIPWASAKDVSQCGETFLLDTERDITQSGLANSSTKMVPKFSTVVVARGATTGRYCMFAEYMTMNQTCYALNSASGRPFLLYNMFGALIGELVQAAHGSVFDTITTKTLATGFVIDAEQVADAFEKIAAPLYEAIENSSRQNRTLAVTRDLLLPKLMSGKIHLFDAEDVSEASR